MKKVGCALILGICLLPLGAETRTGVQAEFNNVIASAAGIEGEWNYLLTGQTTLSFKSTDTGSVRGEVALDFTEAGLTLIPSLKRLYIRPGFGGTLVSIGKTRSTWGAGLAFNAGDIIFGSESLDFDAKAANPRSETAWLTNVQVPIGAFSFIEAIVLPGNVDMTDPLAPVLPTLDKTSVGGRLSVEAGAFNIQTGYLYRGDLIAGLGAAGHRAYFSLEGIAPLDWQLSSSATAHLAGIDVKDLRESWTITGGASYDHRLGIGKDIVLGWSLEFLVKPYAHFAEEAHLGEADYGLFLYPSIVFIPMGNTAYSVSSVVSPVDGSFSTMAGIRWNIYEGLDLLGYYAIQTGDTTDVFNLDNPGGMSVILGASYTY